MNTPEIVQHNSNDPMEASKERREQVQKQKVEEVERDARKTMGVGAMAKDLIRESIITQHDDDKAQHPDDVLVFSRSVHKIDSSLE
ncbi:hypothetical protein Pint_15743 [Pistacia integerrima]|uniref:Uncharacterized protein n=2 Tax=Pistacia integerrima TaxID=434235 RepID=A0ACC0ZE18_9ROSI|nr:hypothetical protein Pint_15744 [Pistacia integerrima]KAJ0049287.1 hypothetical protein Pint_15743 [Pistacia integerrima]